MRYDWRMFAKSHYSRSKFNRLWHSLGVLIFCSHLVSCAWWPLQSNSNNKRAGLHSAINAEITTHLGDKANFIKGDEIHFLLSLSQKSHVLLLYQDANQQLWQLFPNRLRSETTLPPGDFMSFPTREDGIKIVVGPPYGREQVLLYASDLPLPELNFIKSANGMRLLIQDMSAIDELLNQYSAQNHATLVHAVSVINTAEQ